MKDEVARRREELISSVADFDEELMMAFLEEEEITVDQC